MDENEVTPQSTKRGRKPFGEQAMSAAERKRRSRSRKAEEGSAEFMIRIGGGTLSFIDRYAQASGYSRSRVILEFLDMAIAQIGVATATAQQMIDSGATDEDVSAFMYQALHSGLTPQNADAYKEVMGIK